MSKMGLAIAVKAFALLPEDIKRRLSNDEAQYGCGMGWGNLCCRFLLNDGRGFICGRETPLREELLRDEDATAPRIPKKEYPQCQLTDKERNGK